MPGAGRRRFSPSSQYAKLSVLSLLKAY